MRKGQVAQIEEIRALISELPVEAKHKLAQELVARFRELKLDLRMERLDRACAENERRIREITRQAEAALARHDHRKVTEYLEAASQLQRHNAKLFKIIDRTEAKLISAARQVAGQNTEVKENDL